MYICYLIKYSGEKLPPLYIGSTSMENLKNGYRGSVTSIKYGEIFKEELKNNPHLFEYEVLSEHETRASALEVELTKQIEFGVVESSDYFNEALASVNGMFGRDVSGDSNPMYGKAHSEESKKKMSIKRGNKKRYDVTETHREIISKAHKGKKVSENTKSLISENRKGKNCGNDNHMYGKHHTEETIKKLSEARLGKKASDETRKKISEAGMGRIVTKVTRDKLSKAMTGKKISEETKKKISESNTGKKMSEDAINNYKKSRIGMKYKESECPHCGKVGGGGNMTRYHFDNCKLKNK